MEHMVATFVQDSQPHLAHHEAWCTGVGWAHTFTSCSRGSTGTVSLGYWSGLLGKRRSSDKTLLSAQDDQLGL